MTTLDDTRLRYRGINRHGYGIVGRCQYGETAAEAAERFYEAGWRKLIITDDAGTEVGGVGAEISRPRQRTWWGER